MNAYAAQLRLMIARRGWVPVAQTLVGLFFIAAAMYKVQSFFVAGDQSLTRHFEYWVSMDLPPQWYRSLMHTVLGIPGGEKTMEILALTLQAVPGLLFVLNRRTRLAGFLLLIIQTNIFLGTFHHLNFNEFVGGSIWICFFFLLRENDGTFTSRNWNVLTWSLGCWAALFAYNRYMVGDPWLTSVAWQQNHLRNDVLSVAYTWKTLVLWFSSTPIGALAWASVWWVSAVSTVMLFLRRTRLCGGSLLLMFAILRTLTWMNAITSEGVLAVLILFLWVTQEEAREHRLNA